MSLHKESQRILFFIGSLRSGGKERRLIELVTYLKRQGRFEMLVVMTKSEIHYQEFHLLDIPYVVINKKHRSDVLFVIYQLYKLCSKYQPHLIHTWGRIQTLYTLPTALVKRIPIINSQITGAPAKLPKWSIMNIIDRLNFHFSEVILSNSKAGIESFAPPKDRGKVIYNGINMNRFLNLPSPQFIKEKYNIHTPYVVIMVASFSPYKDYDLFFKIATKVISQRTDITFIGVGGFDKGNDAVYRRMLALSSGNNNILFPGKINNVEALINACDIGVLFSTNGEGISNAILEYMALSKPVIVTDSGGTKELIVHSENGYLVPVVADVEIIASMITHLINDTEMRMAFGKLNKKIIDETFCIDKMGEAFEKVYENVLARHLTQPESNVLPRTFLRTKE